MREIFPMKAARAVADLDQDARSRVVEMLRKRARDIGARSHRSAVTLEDAADAEACSAIADLAEAIDWFNREFNIAALRDNAIREAMARCGGHPHPAMKLLGISPSTMYRHLRRLGIVTAGTTTESARRAGQRSGEVRRG